MREHPHASPRQRRAASPQQRRETHAAQTQRRRDAHLRPAMRVWRCLRNGRTICARSICSNRGIADLKAVLAWCVQKKLGYRVVQIRTISTSSPDAASRRRLLRGAPPSHRYHFHFAANVTEAAASRVCCSGSTASAIRTTSARCCAARRISVCMARCSRRIRPWPFRCGVSRGRRRRRIRGARADCRR